MSSTPTPAPASLSTPGLVLLTTNTPNGVKVSIALEELIASGSLSGYTTVDIKLSTADQKTDWFKAVNPNARIPALIHNRPSPQAPLYVWESASILLYLARVYDGTSREFQFAEGSDEQVEMLNWIFFLQGGVGPMQGQMTHFKHFAAEQIPYAIERYTNETMRLYGVYEDRLRETGDWLVKGKYSFADMCTIGWVRAGAFAGVDFEKFPKVQAWIDRCEARPALQRGLNVPDEDKIAGFRKDKSGVERAKKEAQEWVLKGQKDDAEKHSQN